MEKKWFLEKSCEAKAGVQNYCQMFLRQKASVEGVSVCTSGRQGNRGLFIKDVVCEVGKTKADLEFPFHRVKRTSSRYTGSSMGRHCRVLLE